MGSVKKRLGRNVKACRKRIGLTQEQLAEAIGVTKSSIGNLERGVRWPEYDNLQAIATVLGVDEALFFADEVKPAKPTPKEALAVLREYVEKNNF